MLGAPATASEVPWGNAGRQGCGCLSPCERATVWCTCGCVGVCTRVGVRTSLCCVCVLCAYWLHLPTTPCLVPGPHFPSAALSHSELVRGLLLMAPRGGAPSLREGRDNPILLTTIDTHCGARDHALPPSP